MKLILNFICILTTYNVILLTFLLMTVHLAVPDHKFSAMENWGLIIYEENTLLYNKDTSSPINREGVAEIVAHELAHQVYIYVYYIHKIK